MADILQHTDSACWVRRGSQHFGPFETWKDAFDWAMSTKAKGEQVRARGVLREKPRDYTDPSTGNRHEVRHEGENLFKLDELLSGTVKWMKAHLSDLTEEELTKLLILEPRPSAKRAIQREIESRE